MGGKSSKEEGWRSNSSLRSDSSSSWGGGGYQGYPQSSYGQDSYSYSYATPQQPYASAQYYPSSQNSGGDKRRLDRRYSRIADDYKSLDQVTEALARAGLESSNLIVGIDFTKSNEWTGAKSFNRRSLHHIGDGLNPYQQAISIIGKTLAAFDEDNLIPCFGFGDASTHDQDVFEFYPNERFCNGFEEVLSRYREIVPNLRLAGPTSFAPVIEMAATIVEQSGGQYHVLVIIADGQVTRSVDTERGQLSSQEQKTVEAIVKASKLPLSIVLVGVGDGPWDMMKEFDDNIPARDFDNFQFVNFTEIMSKNVDPARKETEFALSALMEIPSQYKATIELNILGRRNGNISERVALPPPDYGASSFTGSKPSRSTSFKPNVSPYQVESQPASSAPPISSSANDHLVSCY
ncbi:E3 ubiquitin-protein ligase rglg2 [Turnera subulata]|uniref:E3 ubiquitin-protein ligase rglg2 n=1 Tax=Turnera subulata TaxID=218843 RepID=A0A9Q0FE00_9ROSI|nr:E3 ubiquitin-protein ligase rglg2 [Turnera subulata]